MNSAFFLFLLNLSLITGYEYDRGSVQCSVKSCLLANRRPCEYGQNFCGPCLNGYSQDGNECIKTTPLNEELEVSPGAEDGSEISTIFDHSSTLEPLISETVPYSPTDDFNTPTSAPATGVDEQENSQESNQKSNQNNAKSDGKGKEDTHTSHPSKNNNIKKLKNGAKSTAKDESLKRLKPKKDQVLEAKRKEDSEKKRDEVKLNKFLAEREENGNVDGSLESESGETNLQVNSSAIPPPFILKKKVGKVDRSELDDIYFLFIVIGCSVAGIAGLALAGYCWYKLHTTAKAVSETEYTGYGLKGSTKHPPPTQGDQKLDYSAEMYHYQQTKSQLAAMEKAGTVTPKGGALDDDDDENSDEGDEGDYTVYECPGLAPTGDMTVVNPMFSDQEAVGSDQDANGDRSGHSSPVAPRHASKPP
ncbi:protein cab-1 [Nematostella vectensis]|uniref:protein cab-1 n=1 Tax=Nematostella vectensis TaxID=45351 RepID=UPI0013905A9D|nr:protein cab-1 [Nematostella vectensis]